MIIKAKKLFGKHKNVNRIADYIVASGIFNVKLKNKNCEWLNYVLETLNRMNEKSKKGIFFQLFSYLFR